MDFKKFLPDDIDPNDIDAINEYLESCTGDCSKCGGSCNVTPNIAKYSLAVAGGRGGSGRSVVTSLLACALARRGLKVGIIDADITCSPIPYYFGTHPVAVNDGVKIFPVKTECGVEIISFSLTRPLSDDPVLISSNQCASVASFFWTNGKWDDMDCVLIDMPGGIGDTPLNIYTTLPLSGVLAVTSPGNYAAALTRQTINLAEMLMLPVRGVIENFNDGSQDLTALLNKEHIPSLGKIPYSEELDKLVDEGKIYDYRCDAVEALADTIAEEIKKM